MVVSDANSATLSALALASASALANRQASVKLKPLSTGVGAFDAGLRLSSSVSKLMKFLTARCPGAYPHSAS